MVSLGINALTLVLVGVSLWKSMEKTKRALRIAVKKGISLLPALMIITIAIGLTLALFPPTLIEQYLGGDTSGWKIALAALVGAITMIPSLIAIPLAGSLVDSGASHTTIASFITTLTMVGLVTLPIELKELGPKITLWRNVLAFVFAIAIALIMGVVL